MKKLIFPVVAMLLALAVSGPADARGQKGMGGCGDCANFGQTGTPSDQFRKFQTDTLDLRQEMMLKRFELQRENLKATPDQAKIAALQADIKVLQTKIHDIRTQSGLPTNMRDGECGPKSKGCNQPCYGSQQ